MEALVACFVVAGFLANDPPPPPLSSSAIPANACLVSLDTPGFEIPWSRLAGKKGTVITWLSLDCPMARGYLPKLNRFQNQYQAKGIQIIGLFPMETVPKGNEEKTKEFTIRLASKVKELGISFPILIDSNGKFQKLLDARVTPEAFLIDPQGKTQYRGRVDDMYSARLESRGRVDREDLALAIESLLSNKPLEWTSTRAYGCALVRPSLGQSTFKNGPTYHADVSPILVKHCQNCHQPGGLAPFPLTTFEESLRWAEDIRDFTKARRMPPWLPTFSVPLRDCRQMETKEIETLAKWVEAGCPEGSPTVPSVNSKPASDPEKWVLGKPDLILDPGADMTIGAEGEDRFRCFVLPTGLTEGRFVTAYEVKPGNPAVVHHMVNFLDNQGRARKLASPKKETIKSQDQGPGYNFSMGPGFFPPTGDLGGWAPGSTPHKISPNVGYWLPPNSDIVMQVHYHRTGKVEKDRSRLGLYFAKPEDKITHPFQVIPVGAPFLAIPSNNSSFPVTGKLWLSDDCTLHMLMPHMHLLGKAIRLSITRPGESEKLLMDIPRWDYNWQEHYFLQSPMSLPKGTLLKVEGTYDNTRSNPRNPFSPPRMVFAGEGTHNEMCFGFFGLTRDAGGPVGVSLSKGGLTLRRLGDLPK